MTISIPHRDPELVQAEAERLYHGDIEKVPTTTINTLSVCGIELSSRYSKADEFETMTKVIHALPPWARQEIKSIFCDSKCGSDYLVILHRWCDNCAQLIGAYLRVALRAINGGFNGLYVRNFSKDSIFGGDKSVDVGGGEWVSDEDAWNEIDTSASAGAAAWEDARRTKVDGWLKQPAGFTVFHHRPGRPVEVSHHTIEEIKNMRGAPMADWKKRGPK
jgi:hypothetical protein